MIAYAIIIAALLLCLAVGTASIVLLDQRDQQLRRFRSGKISAASRIASVSRGTHGLPTTVASNNQSRALPPSPAVHAATFTAPEMSDVGLLSSCLCGERGLWRGLLTADAVCVRCARSWRAVGSRSYFVPLAMLSQFDAAKSGRKEATHD